MMTKTSQVHELVNKGDYKKALRLAKDFRISVTREQAESMQLAYEAMIYPEFYRQIGKDVDRLKAEGIKVLKEITSNTGATQRRRSASDENIHEQIL